jgi:hypothetical protein
MKKFGWDGPCIFSLKVITFRLIYWTTFRVLITDDLYHMKDWVDSSSSCSLASTLRLWEPGSASAGSYSRRGQFWPHNILLQLTSTSMIYLFDIVIFIFVTSKQVMALHFFFYLKIP